MRRYRTDEQRSELIGLVKSGKALVPDAAGRVGVATSTAYRWLREAAATSRRRFVLNATPEVEEAAGPTFVRLVPRQDVDGAIAIWVGGAEIRIRRGFDEELLRAVVSALGGGAE